MRLDTKSKQAQSNRKLREECEWKREQEREALAEIIRKVTDIDIACDSKNRDVVNARIIFSKILIDKGHTRTEVGARMKRNHSTATHHYHRFEGYIKFDKKLRDLYNMIEGMFFGDYDPIYDMDMPKLRETTIAYREQVLELENKVRELKQKLIAQRHHNERFGDIHKTLLRSVPQGMEEHVNKKLQSMLNGLSGR